MFYITQKDLGLLSSRAFWMDHIRQVNLWKKKYGHLSFESSEARLQAKMIVVAPRNVRQTGAWKARHSLNPRTFFTSVEC